MAQESAQALLQITKLWRLLPLPDAHKNFQTLLVKTPTEHLVHVLCLLTMPSADTCRGMGEESAAKAVDWDGNGLAYPRRTGFSAHSQTSVVPDTQSMSQCV